MKGNLTSDVFINFIRDIILLGVNSENQTNQLTEATNNIQRYIDRIKEADYYETDQLNKMVIAALGKINFKLECLRSKLAIVAGVRDGCVNGTTSFDQLFQYAKSREKKIVDSCINQNYMTKSGLQKVTAETMKIDGLQPICICNNTTKKTLACNNWYVDMSDDENMKSVGDVSLEDIKFFVSFCPPAPLTKVIKTTICQRKEENKNLTEVLYFYQKYIPAAVRSIFDRCELSNLQKEKLCNLKRNGLNLVNIQLKFTHYNLTILRKTFNSCSKLDIVKESKMDRMIICKYRNEGWMEGSSTSRFLYDLMRAKYTDTAITNVDCSGQIK